MLALFCGLAPASAQERAFANPPSVEQDLAGNLASALAAARDARARLLAGGGADAAAPLAIALGRIRAADLLLADKHQARGQALAEEGASAPVLARQLQMSALLRGQLEALGRAAGELHAASTAGDRTRLTAAVEAVIQQLASASGSSVDRTPLGVTLPHRPLNLPQVAPAPGAPVVPAYLQPVPPAPASADSAAAADVPLSPEIVARARALGFNPIAIFEFVQTQVATEFYYGAMKGAQQTLAEKSGNDLDQASLLIALLRASGIPARYVRGVVRLTDREAQAWTSVGSARRAAEVLTRGGVPFTPVRQGGVIAGLQVEHTWVTAYVPYANYRGAPLDSAGRAWVPLDPSYKAPQISGGLPAGLAFTGGALVAQYLSGPQALPPLDFFTARISTLLAAAGGPTLDQALFRRTLPPAAAGLLPSTLPYETISVSAELTEIPAELRHTVRFVAHGADGDGGVAFDVTLAVSDLLGRRLTLSYVPASVEDQIVSASFLGLDNTPAYLVRVRPVIKVGGVIRAAGEASVQMGDLHRVTLELRTPRIMVPVSNVYVAGGYYAIGLAGSATTYAAVAGAPEDTERPAADLLYRQASDYLAAWNDAERALSELLHVVNVSPMVSEVVVGNVYNRTLLFGQPQSIDWRGVFVDADLRISEPVPAGAEDTRSADFLRLSGLAGSMLEGSVLEDNLGVDAVSAAKLLQLANAGGVPIRQIDAANAAAELPLLQTADIVKTEISDAVRQGWLASVPVRDFARNAWTGLGYVLTDPVTGAGGYFISGGIAGGMSAQDPAAWVQQQYVRELGRPYQDLPNRDANAAFSIRKVVVTDQQEGVAGQPIDRPLAVWVRDAQGKPVEGATVTFSVVAGGGQFGAAEEVVAQTDNLGIATARPTLGRYTAMAPFYVKSDASDTHATQVGENIIQARVRGAGGDIGVATPFQLFGFPGEPVQILKVLGDGNRAVVGTAGGTVRARLVDLHGNPISNRTIDFTVQPATAVTGVLPPAARNLALFKASECSNPSPLLDDCNAAPQQAVVTSVFGADVEAIMGDTIATDYHVAAASAGVPTPNLQADDCRRPGPFQPLLRRADVDDDPAVAGERPRTAAERGGGGHRVQAAARRLADAGRGPVLDRAVGPCGVRDRSARSPVLRAGLDEDLAGAAGRRAPGGDDHLFAA